MIEPNKLALMAENICDNCVSPNQNQQVKKIITHMHSFWTATMCKDLVQAYDSNQVKLSPVMQQVVKQLLDTKQNQE